MKQSVAAEVDGAQGVVTNLPVDSDTDDKPTRVLQALRDDPELDAVQPIYTGVWTMLTPEKSGNGNTATVVRFDEARPEPFGQVDLVKGKLSQKQAKSRLLKRTRQLCL